VTTKPTKSVNIPIADRDPAVAALVKRCGRITQDEASVLAAAWRGIEDDLRAGATIAEGRRLARQAGPDADEAAEAADWAFRWTLGIPCDGAIYADTLPFEGRAIAAIRSRAMVVALGDAIPADVAEAMSGPWLEAIDPD
jgi:hypothetical protein